MIYNLPTAKKDYCFVNIITNICHFCLENNAKWCDDFKSIGILCSSLQDQKLFKIVDQSCWWSFLCASFVRFLSKFIVQDDYCLFYSSISYAQFTGTRMWCTELHFVTHVSHALVILFTSLQMNWDDCTALKLGMARLSKGLILYTGLKSKSGSN